MVVKGSLGWNKQISLLEAFLNFQSSGLYHIDGENGCGKTTLLEDFLFEDRILDFEAFPEHNFFLNKRYALFSYVPQTLPVPELSVCSYIKKNNTFSNHEIIAWLNRFSLSQEILTQSFNLLSGGEQVKIAIITAILKNTPYIIFDEPSNHLDDSASEVLRQVMLELSENHVVIYTTHDPRLNFDESTVYLMKDGTLNLVRDGKKHSSKVPPSELVAPSFKSILRSLVSIRATFILLLTMFLLTASLVIFSEIRFRSQMNTEPLPEKNHILVYSGFFDSLNQEYCEIKHLYIPSEIQTKQLRFSDLAFCLSLDGVEKMFHWDEKYVRQIKTAIQSDTAHENLYYLSVPSFFISDFWMISGVDLGLRFIEGRYPADNANEVVLSKRILKEHFAYTDSEIEQAIGRQITLSIDGVSFSFTIVGLSVYDYVLISYNENFSPGVLQINESNIDTNIFYLSSNRNSLDEDPDLIYELFLVTETGKEEAVLNQLFTSFPSDNYYSFSFASAWIDWYNHTVYYPVFLINLLGSLVFSFVLWLITRNLLKAVKSMLQELGNYYINRKRMVFFYFLYVLLSYFLLSILLFALSAPFSRFIHLLFPIIFFDIAILLFPSLSTMVLSIKAGRL